MSNFRSTGEFFLPSRVSPEKTQLTKFHKRGVSSCNLAVSKENTWFRWHPSVIPVCQLLRHNLHLHFQVCDLSVSRVYSNRTTPAVNIESSSTTWEFPRFIPPPPMIWFGPFRVSRTRSVGVYRRHLSKPWRPLCVTDIPNSILSCYDALAQYRAAFLLYTPPGSWGLPSSS